MAVEDLIALKSNDGLDCGGRIGKIPWVKMPYSGYKQEGKVVARETLAAYVWGYGRRVPHEELEWIHRIHSTVDTYMNTYLHEHLHEHLPT